MIRVCNFSIPQYHLIAILWRARKKESIMVKTALPALATSSLQSHQQRGLCHLTLIAKCASCQRTPSRGSGTSSWGRTTSEKRLRASSPSWLVSFKEVGPNVTSSSVHSNKNCVQWTGVIKLTGSQIHVVQSQWEHPKMQLNLVGRLSGGHKCAVLIFLLEPLMDFGVTKCMHVLSSPRGSSVL